MDDGVEGYLSQRLDKYSKPVFCRCCTSEHGDWLVPRLEIHSKTTIRFRIWAVALIAAAHFL
jgi:hypothetical protein